jgi:RHS repeat-associated protein
VGNRTTLTETLIAVQDVPAGAYLESDGLVVMEAENGQVISSTTHAWLTATKQSGYTGTAYLQALPDIDALYQTNEMTNSARTEYAVNFTTPGTYTVWLRGYASSAAGDSVYVKLDDDVVNVTGFAPHTWEWAGQPESLVVETTGLRTVNLVMREDGLRVDRLLLTTDTNFIPSDFGPVESERQTETSSFIVNLERTISYEYDALYRLTKSDYTSGESYEYSYDPVGNRLQQIIDGDTTDYLYDAANRLAEVDGQSYTFDANGNLLSTGILTNTWDAANRLVEISRNDTTVQPIYNGINDRVGQTVGITTTYFALDVIGLPEVIQTSAGSSYLHLPGVIMTESAEGEVRYLLSDGLGSVRQAVDETGAVISYHEFDPYGNPVSQPSSLPSSQPYGYTGEWWDEVGLLHLRARWYAPETGTFLSRDAWEGDRFYPQSLNGWNYVEANPIRYTDPSGQCWGLTGKALEICERARERVQRKTIEYTTKFEVITNDCQTLVKRVSSKVLASYNSGRERLRNRIGLDNRIDQSMPIIPHTNIPFTNYKIPFTGGKIPIPYTNLAEAMVLELLGQDRAYLGGDVIDLIRADPAMIAYENELIAAIENDSRYMQEDFIKEFGDKGRQFGGDRYRGDPMWPDQALHPWRSEYRPTWAVAFNELGVLVRSLTLENTNAQISKDGSFTIYYHFEDELDLEPNRSEETADGRAYNAITTVLGFFWHKGLRATEMETIANWSSSYPK